MVERILKGGRGKKALILPPRKYRRNCRVGKNQCSVIPSIIVDWSRAQSNSKRWGGKGS
jgi:hypothetical protein